MGLFKLAMWDVYRLINDTSNVHVRRQKKRKTAMNIILRLPVHPKTASITIQLSAKYKNFKEEEIKVQQSHYEEYNSIL